MPHLRGKALLIKPAESPTRRIVPFLAHRTDYHCSAPSGSRPSGHGHDSPYFYAPTLSAATPPQVWYGPPEDECGPCQQGAPTLAAATPFQVWYGPPELKIMRRRSTERISPFPARPAAGANGLGRGRQFLSSHSSWHCAFFPDSALSAGPDLIKSSSS